MTCEQIVRAWNAQADEHNQYDTLSDRERIEFALSLAGKVEKKEPAIPKFNCWSSDDGDTWFDHPADAQLLQDVGAEKVGDEFEVSAGWHCVTARYMVIKAPDDLNDDFEVECISHREENQPEATIEKQEPIDDLEDLLEEYWNLAYNEGKNKRVRGDGKTLDKIRALFSAKQQPCPEGEKLKSEHAKSEAAWATGIDAAPSKEKACSTHPDAPHGFDRTASHSLGRYVCICEGWEPSA